MNPYNPFAIGARRAAMLLPALLVMACWATPGQAQQLIPAGSEIAFTSRQMGVPVDGQFRKWNATIQFDVKKPEAGKVAFTIDMGSATLGAADTDAEVAKADWFHTARFPQAQFQSSAIKAVGKGRYEVSGALTIKGNTQTVTVPVPLSQQGSGARLLTTATAQFTLRPQTLQAGQVPWVVAPAVGD